MTPAMITAIGTLLLGITGMSGVIAGVANRTKIGAFIADRAALQRNYDAAMRAHGQALETLKRMQEAVDSQRQTIEAKNETLDELTSRVAHLEAIQFERKIKFDALIAYVVRLIKYVVFLERTADRKGQMMPPAPAAILEELHAAEAVADGI